ncbi:MAG: hypothetical protein ABI867_43180 [Kofleriaceae bacterium]
MWRWVLAVVVVGCAHRVPQDLHTGRDGSIEGASPMRPHGTHRWFARGEVTYPGGDRVDWHRVTLPKQRGSTRIELELTARPGTQVSFDVFDARGELLRGTRDGEPVYISDHEELFIRVYAVRRGDAGAYVLSAWFEEQIGTDTREQIEVPEPPRLPAVPDPVPCTEDNFDALRVACHRVCVPAAPAHWPACGSTCPVPPDANVRACWSTMPCPSPPDPRVKACRMTRTLRCPPGVTCVSAREVVGRIIKLEVVGSDVLITIAAGSTAGVRQSWHGQVARDPRSTEQHPRGELVIVRVDKQVTVAKVSLTPDQVRAWPWARLEAP